jgi:hypothetical protein
MVKEAVGKYAPAKMSRTGVIYVPSLLAMDSAFPFRACKVNIRIDGQRLIIERVEEAAKAEPEEVKC